MTYCPAQGLFSAGSKSCADCLRCAKVATREAMLAPSLSPRRIGDPDNDLLYVWGAAEQAMSNWSLDPCPVRKNCWLTLTLGAGWMLAALNIVLSVESQG